MRRLYILTDEEGEYLVSKSDFRNFTSMDVKLINDWFRRKDYDVKVCKFSEFDTDADYRGAYVLYQTSEAPGTFYKRYIEDLVFFLEKQGAVTIPCHEYLKAHHNKVFMEFLRKGFNDESLKTIRSVCYGSWTDALNYAGDYPAVIKQASGSGSKGVYLARNRRQYRKNVKKAGRTIIASGMSDLVTTFFKNQVKKFIKFLYPSRSGYVQYNTAPVSSAIIVQNFIEGLGGDYKVLYFGGKYYCLYRANRDNDFRASGSGRFFDVPDDEQEGLLDFAHRLTLEINFPVIGMDIGFDGKCYHLIEFQMIHLGTSALQRSAFWHEYTDGRWVRRDGSSILEIELARSLHEFILTKEGQA
jgi:glutathione synthase/RimK-type ligase-like ATP-grasp enzyme